MAKKTESNVIEPRSRFLEVECKKCGKRNIVFDKASSKVECECGEEIASPTGGYARLRAKVLKNLE